MQNRKEKKQRGDKVDNIKDNRTPNRRMEIEQRQELMKERITNRKKRESDHEQRKLWRYKKERRKLRKI